MLLPLEPQIREALENDGRPKAKQLLKDYFPELIGEKNIPVPYPDEADASMCPLFTEAGYSPMQVIQQVRGAIDNVLNGPETLRKSYRSKPAIFHKMMATTTAGWARKSNAHFRDWLPIAGGAFLEMHLVKVYRTPVLMTEFGHVRVMLGDILTDCAKTERVIIPGKRTTIGVKSYTFVDGLSAPADLPPLENVLQIDAEKLYRQEQSRMEGRKGLQGLINYVAAMEGARTYLEEFVDVSKLKGKAKKEAVAGSMVVQTPYLQLDVSVVLLELVRVSDFSFYSVF